jgi:hypothetical protein
MTEMSGGTVAARFPGASPAGDRSGIRQQSLEALLGDMEPSSAGRARAAMGWMVPEGASFQELGQVELQEFLWYELPLRWEAETGELHEIACALADLFSAAGLERFAVLCRAPRTHQLLDAWQDSDPEPARRMLKEAIRVSGVDPPDVTLLGWGSVMGSAEHAARQRVSQALEQAIDAGELVPGERGWKQLAARVTAASLMMPRIDLRGGTLLQSVYRERGQSWAAGAPDVRQDLLTRMLPLLAGEVAVPAEATGSLMPLRWLLEHIGDGVTLTQAGWLPKALVLRANDAFGWFDLFGFTVRTETDLPELACLNELSRRARLVTRSGSRLSLSGSGRRALGDVSLLWRTVVADIFSPGTYEGEGAALAAAILVRASAAVPRPTVEAKVGASLKGRWRTASGESLEPWSGLDATREFALLADVFGWLEHDQDWQNRTWRLTPAGRKAALLGLQLQARSPRNRV